MSSGSTPNFNLPILFLFVYLQASCRSLQLSKHLTCVSRIHSQPQPVEIFSMLISRQVVGVFTCPNTSLVSPGLTPNFSLSRYTQALHKNMSSQAINWQVTSLKWPYSQHAQKWKWNKNTSSESRILKLFDALCFTSAMYQPSVDCKSLVQAQHISLQKIQELNTNDLSFTLDGVLSTLQQGSAENGVGSSVELRYHVEKAPCTDLRSDPTLHPKFLQNYAGRRVRQPRTPN